MSSYETHNINDIMRFIKTIKYIIIIMISLFTNKFGTIFITLQAFTQRRIYGDV